MTSKSETCVRMRGSFAQSKTAAYNKVLERNDNKLWGRSESNLR